MIDIAIGTGLFQYFIKVIPTIYTNEIGERLYTNQYTYTERFRPLTITNPDGTTQLSPVSIYIVR